MKMKQRQRLILFSFLTILSLVCWNIFYALIYDTRRFAAYGKAALQDSLTGKLEQNFIAPAVDFWNHLPSWHELMTYGLRHFYLSSGVAALILSFAVAAVLFFLLTCESQDDIHGNARLMKKTELKTSGLHQKQGLILGKSGRITLRDENQSHVMVIGPPSSGKTECFVIPNLIEWQGSFIALDFKGTLFERTAKLRQQRGNSIYLFAPGYESSHTYNPLDMIRDGVPCITDIQALASLLVPVLDERSAHWNNSAQMLLTGMISYVLESGECKDKRTLGTVGRLFSITDHFQDTPGISNFTYARLTEFLAIPFEEAGSIRSTLTTHLKPWQNPSIEALTQSGDNAIKIDNLRSEAMSVYLAIDTGQLEIFAPLLKLFLEQVNSFVNRAYRREGEHKILFMIDEFYQLGKINSIIKQLPFARDRDIRICLVSQGVAQIDEKFTRAGRESILASCVLQLFCSFNDEPTVELVSKKTGQKTIHYKSNSRQMEPFGKPAKRSQSEHAMAQPLFRSNELYGWNRDHLLILKVNAQPFICDKILADKTKSYISAIKEAATETLDIPELVSVPEFLPTWAAKIARKTVRFAKDGKQATAATGAKVQAAEKMPDSQDYQTFLEKLPASQTDPREETSYKDLLATLDNLVALPDNPQPNHVPK